MGKKPVRSEDVGVSRTLRKIRKKLDKAKKEIRRKRNRDPRWKF